MGHGVIRVAYDEGPGVGLGHRRRMEALAAALEEAGAEVALAPLDGRGAEGDVVVIDSYALRADDRSLVRGRRVAAVDDLERDLAVDVVVDPAGAGGAGGAGGAAEAGAAGRVLAGFGHALLDPRLTAVEATAPGEHVAVVLVATGGADGGGVGARIAGSLRARLPQATVRLVVGPWGAPDVPAGVEAVTGVDGLHDELRAADLVVTAAGVTLLEALVLGRPAVAFCTAANQARSLDRLVAERAVERATVESAADVAADLAADPERRARLGHTGPAVVDGLGAHRVAQAVVALR